METVCNQLQDMASCHADAMGFGFKDLKTSGHYWVLARLHVMLDRLPVYGQAVTATTWPSGNERLVALRDFLLHDDDGLMGRATTSWVTLNAETHRPDPPDTVLHERFIPDRERALLFPSKAVMRIKNGDHATRLTARRADIDINGHVNNVRYVEYALEAVPQDWTDARQCLGLDIQFRHEAFAGDRIESACSAAETDNGRETALHSLTRVEDNAEIVRMRSWWK